MNCEKLPIHLKVEQDASSHNRLSLLIFCWAPPQGDPQTPQGPPLFFLVSLLKRDKETEEDAQRRPRRQKERHFTEAQRPTVPTPTPLRAAAAVVAAAAAAAAAAVVAATAAHPPGGVSFAPQYPLSLLTPENLGFSV